jgi:hypothetical protein
MSWLASAVQNLAWGFPGTGAHSAVCIMLYDGNVGRVDLEDCLQETMAGRCMFYVRPDACGSLGAGRVTEAC